MGIRLESPILGKEGIDTGQLRFSHFVGNTAYDFTLDGAGVGFGGHYFVRRRGFGKKHGKVVGEGVLQKDEIGHVFIFGRIVTFTGT